MNNSMVKFIHELSPQTSHHYKHKLDDNSGGELIGKGSGGKISGTLNAIYSSWFAKYREVIQKNRDYHSLNNYNSKQLETIRIHSGFTYDNGLRSANSWIKRDYVYGKLLQRQLH